MWFRGPRSVRAQTVEQAKRAISRRPSVTYRTARWRQSVPVSACAASASSERTQSRLVPSVPAAVKAQAVPVGGDGYGSRVGAGGKEAGFFRREDEAADGARFTRRAQDETDGERGRDQKEDRCGQHPN